MFDDKWITRANCEALKTFIHNCHVPIIVSGIDGTIHWANDEFCEWSGYSVQELQQLGWHRLSVENQDLAADISAAGDLDGYRLTYSIQKQYIPKNDKPYWGTLSVMRYPATGQIDYCLCTWIPLKNGTQTAFDLAMRELGKLTMQIEGNRADIAKLTALTNEEIFMNAGVRLIKANPKTAWAIVVVVFGIFGFNNVLQIVTGLHLLPIPAASTTEHK